MYHLMTVDELTRYAPGFAWKPFLDAKGFGAQSELIVETDTAVAKLASLFADTPVETWRSYLAFHTIDSLAEYLSPDWQQAHFDFYSGRLQGIKQRRPLKDRAIGHVSDYLGEPLGHAYVDRYFPPEYRTQMERLVANLRAAFRNRLEKNDWMDEPTRKEALAKLDGITSHIGYPDRWRDYSALRLDPTDLVGNAKAIAAFEDADSLAALKETRRDWQWSYSPQTVNAGYAPDLNSITFPAAILQPPFFDPNADPAVNYGAIGAVIGHELGHAFDDQGSQSDADGLLRNWWSDASRREFDKRVKVLVDQFDAYVPVEGMHVNGALTLGENIGDLGGVTVAYDAYHLSLRPAVDGPVIDGLTGDQRFFMAWAQVWRELSTSDAIRQQILSDPHSPGEFRANGALRNVDAWYSAFGVKEGDAFYLPEGKRAKIW
jgi:endothelin-converting enzyme/putative endopeptidase